MARLELKNIVKRFKSQIVLDDLSLTVPDGETLVLFGPSGAGKTVLLRLIAGVIEVDGGQILIDGEDVTDVDAEFRGIGMAFQNFALFPHMSAYDNIATPLEAKRASKSATKTAVESVATLLKIGHVLDHKPRALSNGQKQRTALARALVGSPPILLLDDPLRNVDAKLRFEMRLELPRLLAGQGATVVYVTQDYKEAMALGDRIAVMSQGVVRQLGTPEQIYHQPANIEIARLFGDPTINLLNVKPSRDSRGVFVGLSSVQVHLAGAPESAVGHDCVIGLRPEALSFVDEETQGAVPVTVEAETPLNEKIVTLVRTLRGREILVSRPSGTPGRAEGKAHIAVDGASALLFDLASGTRMGRENVVPLRSGAVA
ncbi:ABC transporter ATP-binding protein [soil metagenome]